MPQHPGPLCCRDPEGNEDIAVQAAPQYVVIVALEAHELEQLVYISFVVKGVDAGAVLFAEDVFGFDVHLFLVVLQPTENVLDRISQGKCPSRFYQLPFLILCPGNKIKSFLSTIVPCKLLRMTTNTSHR